MRVTKDDPELDQTQPGELADGGAAADARGRGRPRKSDARQTRIRVLDAAEELIARHGFQEVSLRDVTRKAGVNVALVKYHFRNKVGLLYAVLERRAVPINAERHRLLDECIARAGTQKRPDVEEVLEAFIGPILLAHKNLPGGENLQRLFGVAQSDPSPEIRRAIHHVFHDVARRFVDVLRRACPDLDPEEFHWRLTCVFGTIIYLFADPGRVHRIVGTEFDSKDKTVALRYIVPILAAAMSQPASPRADSGAKPDASVVPIGTAKLHPKP